MNESEEIDAMIRKRIYKLDEKEWAATRKDLTKEVYGKSLIPEDLTNNKIVLTKVNPGGEFTLHKDPYHHIFYFLSGKGEGKLGEETYQIKPNLVVEVPAGEIHGYKNTGETDLLLLTVNIPIS